jgi:hypothetical protein
MVIDSPAAIARAETDPAHGGRWTSLHLRGRQWLWTRQDQRRFCVRPGDAFVDAGGLEECIPTVRGTPDHGAAWSRPWNRDGNNESVDCGEFRLRRTLRCAGDTVTATYELTAPPGYRFLWAAHALLDVSPAATLELPDGAPVRLYPEAAVHLQTPWPDGAPYVVGNWPDPYGLPLSRLGPDDGTAIGATVPDCRRVDVVDGADQLTMTLHVDAATPTSISLWRNLRGFPTGHPYRSIGVEPMLGSVFDLNDAVPRDAAVVPESGTLQWQLHVTARRVDA